MYRTKASIRSFQDDQIYNNFCYTTKYSDFCSSQAEKLKRNMLEIKNPDSVKSSMVKLITVILSGI